MATPEPRHALLRRLIACVGIVVVAASLLWLWSTHRHDGHAQIAPKPAASLHFLTMKEDSDEGSTPYSRIGGILATELGFSPLATIGSLDTLMKMEARGSSVGIVQADVLYHYVNGEHPQMLHRRSETDQKLRAISVLFPEMIHLSGPSNVHGRLLPNRHRQVCGGQFGTGSWITAQNIKRLLPTEWESLMPSGREGCRSQNADSIQIHVRSEPIRPSGSLYFDEYQAMVLESQFLDVYRAQPCDRRTSERLTRSFGRLSRCRSPKGLNAGWSVATDAILVATTDVPPEVVAALLSKVAELDRGCTDDEGLRPELKTTLFCDASGRRFAGFPIAAHLETKKRVLAEQGWATSWLLSSAGSTSVVVVLAVLATVVVLSVVAPPLINAFGILKVLAAVAIAICMFLVFSGAIFLAEFHANPYFEIEAADRGFRWLSHYWVVGEPLENLKSPLSLTFVMAGNVFVFLVIGLIGAILTTKLLGVRKPVRNHVIVLGVSELQKKVAAELFAQDEVYVLAAIRHEREGLRNASPSTLLGGDLQEALRRACFEWSHSIILLADREAARASEMGIDEHTLSIARTIRRIEREGDVSDVKVARRRRIVAEIVHQESEIPLTNHGVDEVVCVNSFGVELLAHAITKANIVSVFKELTVTTSGMEVYLDGLSTNMIRAVKTFGGLQNEVYKGDGSSGYGRRLLIGIMRAANNTTKQDSENLKQPSGRLGWKRRFLGTLGWSQEVRRPASGVGAAGVLLNPEPGLRLSVGDVAIVIAAEPRR